MKKLKILFFPVWYPNHLNRIAGKFVFEHAKVIHQHTELAIFYVLSDPSSKALFRYEVLNEDGICVYRSYSRRFNKACMFPLNFVLFVFASIYGYCKVYKNFGKADLNHVHVLTRGATIPLFLKFIHRTPYVITEHWSRYLPERDTYKGFFRKLLTKMIVRHSSGISAVSKTLKKALGMHGLTHSNFPIINNTVNGNKFFLPPTSRKPEVYTFLHISGMEDHIKNISGILAAAKTVKSTGRKFELHFVGHSREVENFKEFVFHENMEKEVFFHGHVDKGISEYFHKSDAFILFSHFENQPVVLIESFLCGVPVIAARAGGIPEMVNADNGLLVTSGSHDELALAMIKFIDGNVSFNKATIRSSAQNKYGAPSVAGQLLNFYANALSSH